ncbi:hypothetical protein ACFQH9_18810 [Pseudonocardia lutea]|jgi:hypothetical protein|uniref:Uncharacterized protein n=1 Tax=Pseudonocardia lutea TaxID=2172015 RepID=A0ABW1ICC8_9PSEU
MTDPQEQREQAREAVESLPGETALGNPDPTVPNQEDPGQYEREHAGRYADEQTPDPSGS